MGSTIPLVNYLDTESGTLIETVCEECHAVYFGRRIACARCGGRRFGSRNAPRKGHVVSFTIIHRGPPGIETPYVSALVELEDTTMVKANVVGCEPSPDVVTLGMPVELETYQVGTDDLGVAAVAFGFRPVEQPEGSHAD